METCDVCSHPIGWHSDASYRPSRLERMCTSTRVLERIDEPGCRGEGCACGMTWSDLHRGQRMQLLATGVYKLADGTYAFSPAAVLEVARALRLSIAGQVEALLAATVQRALDLDHVPPLPTPPAEPIVLLDVDESIDLEERDGMFRAA